MKILVVGGGGREHALVWKISQSPKVKTIYCAPGNVGIAEMATCVPINAEDTSALLAFAKKHAVDLTVVGPEGPLSSGIVDLFEGEGLRIFGATQKAARIEASKSFAKDLMIQYGIPTAAGKTFSKVKDAEAYLKEIPLPVVIKADGLAAGKGVVVCRTPKEASETLHAMMVARIFGDAGDNVVIEECLTGEECSFLAFTDGKTVLPLPTSQDHKAIFDNDKGPNTGGMGAYSPAPVVDHWMHQRIIKEVMLPAVQAMASEGCPYKGVLYAGLMIDRDKLRVLEFNARFGDPETQPLLARVQNDIVPIMEAVIDGKLASVKLDIDPRASVCVVMAAGGYPGSYKKGFPITGLDKVKRMKDVMVFHAGTGKTGTAVTAEGGRVLGVTALGETVGKAIDQAYKAVGKISWEKVQYRSDIGKKAMIRGQIPPAVSILMGSDSDLPVMQETVAVLKKFDIPFEITIASAHRTPERAASIASSARSRGVKVIIAGAGQAAHLAGALAAQTTLPVIGVPIDSSSLQGMDALLSTVQMPPGVPVATVAIGKVGARNAGILAAQMLSIADARIAAELEKYKADMAAEVNRKAEKLALGC